MGIQRGTAYGGAGGATTAVAIAFSALSLLGPIGLLAYGLTTGITAAVSFGTAAGITECHSIRAIEDMYGHMVKNIKSVQLAFKTAEAKIKDLTENIRKKEVQMSDIACKMSGCLMTADLAPEYGFINFLNEDVTKLHAMCEEYLKM